MSAANKFKKVFKADSLEDIYFDSIKYNIAVGIDRVNSKAFEKRLFENIEIIRKKSLSGTYKFSQFREKLISRGAKKYPRLISIPTVRDKLALKALFEVLFSVYGNVLPLIHKMINEVAESISEEVYDEVLRLDVKDFYPSIRHDLLINQLSKRIKKKEILYLIKNSISQQTVAKPISGVREQNSVGLPQGLSISNILANIYMQPIDRKFKKRTTIRYFRYVDDILVLCKKNKSDGIKKEIVEQCKKINLTIHDDNSSKTRTGAIHQGFDYLGYVFKDLTISVRKKSLNNLRESIIKHFTDYKYSENQDTRLLTWTLNTRITGCIFNETKYGWLFFFSQINDRQLLSSLDHFIKKQMIRFGIDPKKIKIKRFVRAYHEINKNLNNTSYIPNFDELDLKQKREILLRVFGYKAKRMSRSEIEYHFKKKIFRTVKDLERDLGRLS